MPDPVVTLPTNRAYMTVAELKGSVSGVDWTQIIPAGSTATEDAAVANLILQASSRIDGICHQTLAPQRTAEVRRVVADQSGGLYVKTNQFPIIRVVSFQWQTMDPRSGWTSWTYNPKAIDVDERHFEVYVDAWPGIPYRVQYVYENGFPNTVTTVDAAASDPSILVADPLGVYPGQELQIFDNDLTELVVVAATYVDGSTTVPLVAPLLNAHVAGTGVSALPAAVKQAVRIAVEENIGVPVLAGVALQETPGENIIEQTRGQRRDRFAQLAELLAPYTRTF